MSLLILFIIGLFFGSFLNVIIERIAHNTSFIKDRSKCDFCAHTLAWFDLIPLLSFISLKGKCRYCHKKLSFQYPLMEFLTGVIFVITFLFVTNSMLISNVKFQMSNFRLFLQLVFYLYIIASLIVIFVIDLKYGIIPFSIVFPAIGVTVLFMILDSLFFIHLLSGLSAFLFFFLLHLGTKGRGIGFGDVVYVLLMGLLLGFPGIVIGLYIAFLTGAVISLILVLAKKKQMRGGTVPFGPFLVFGTVCALFFGENISSIIKTFLYG